VYFCSILVLTVVCNKVVVMRVSDVEGKSTSKSTFSIVAWISSICAYVCFIAWAVLPSKTLRYIGVTYYPSRYYAVALPAYVLVMFALCGIAYIGLNLLKTLDPEDKRSAWDKAGGRQLMPTNKRHYRSRHNHGVTDDKNTFHADASISPAGLADLSSISLEGGTDYLKVGNKGNHLRPVIASETGETMDFSVKKEEPKGDSNNYEGRQMSNYARYYANDDSDQDGGYEDELKGNSYVDGRVYSYDDDEEELYEDGSDTIRERNFSADADLSFGAGGLQKPGVPHEPSPADGRRLRPWSRSRDGEHCSRDATNSNSRSNSSRSIDHQGVGIVDGGDLDGYHDSSRAGMFGAPLYFIRSAAAAATAAASSATTPMPSPLAAVGSAATAPSSSFSSSSSAAGAGACGSASQYADPNAAIRAGAENASYALDPTSNSGGNGEGGGGGTSNNSNKYGDDGSGIPEIGDIDPVLLSAVMFAATPTGATASHASSSRYASSSGIGSRKGVREGVYGSPSSDSNSNSNSSHRSSSFSRRHSGHG
jgi:hypothetical protein